MIPWPVAGQAPLSMQFSKQEYWSGLPFPALGDSPDPWVDPTTQGWNPHLLQFLHFLHWQVGSLSLCNPESPFFFFLLFRNSHFSEMDLHSHERRWHLGGQNSKIYRGWVTRAKKIPLLSLVVCCTPRGKTSGFTDSWVLSDMHHSAKYMTWKSARSRRGLLLSYPYPSFANGSIKIVSLIWARV